MCVYLWVCTCECARPEESRRGHWLCWRSCRLSWATWLGAGNRTWPPWKSITGSWLHSWFPNLAGFHKCPANISVDNSLLARMFSEISKFLKSYVRSTLSTSHTARIQEWTNPSADPYVRGHCWALTLNISTCVFKNSIALSVMMPAHSWEHQHRHQACLSEHVSSLWVARQGSPLSRQLTGYALMKWVDFLPESDVRKHP